MGEAPNKIMQKDMKADRTTSVEEKMKLKKPKVLEVPTQVWRRYGFLLLWAAVGLDLIISILGYPVVGQLVSAVFVMMYLLDHVSLRRVVCSFWFAAIDTFFREISIGGDTKLEPLKDGRAVIVAVAPHVNQFIDPIVVMKAVAEKTKRHVSWMTAAKSMRRSDIGGFARAMKCIPVERPDDMETKGAGFVTSQGHKVTGSGGSQFTKEFSKGAILIVKQGGKKLTAKVAQVVSDSEMILSGPLQYKAAAAAPKSNMGFNRALTPIVTIMLVITLAVPTVVGFYFTGLPLEEWWALVGMLAFQFACILTHLIYGLVRDGVPHSAIAGEYVRNSHTLVSGQKDENGNAAAENGNAAPAPEAPKMIDVDVKEPTAFSFLPYVDQHDMFEQVHRFLIDGGTIGIFPEGGTHDGTQLLPLKWGISVMLLGAMAKHEGPGPLKISVLPVGLNYFAPHKFRSTVSVDFGDPIDVSEELVEMYKNGTKEQRQEANKEVMELIMAGVQGCTLQAKDVETLHLYRTLRRLYVPFGTRLSVADNVALTQGFAGGVAKNKDNARVKACMAEVSQYSKMLLEYRVRDHQVQRFKDKVFTKGQQRLLLFTTCLRLIYLAVVSVLLLPWWLVIAPSGLVGRVISDVQAKKVNKMSVIGTWKVLMAAVAMPLFHVFYTACFWTTFGRLVGFIYWFFAPLGGIIAVYATEDGIRVVQSLNALLLLVRRKDIGQELYTMREKLRKEVYELQKEQGWLEIDPELRKKLEHRQVIQKGDSVSGIQDLELTDEAN